jgi:hypothetical protein
VVLAAVVVAAVVVVVVALWSEVALGGSFVHTLMVQSGNVQEDGCCTVETSLSPHGLLVGGPVSLL